MDNGTTRRFSRSPRSISDLGHAVGCLAAELRECCRAAFLGRQFLPVISVTDTSRASDANRPSTRFSAWPSAAPRSQDHEGRFQRKVSTPIEHPGGTRTLQIGYRTD